MLQQFFTDTIESKFIKALLNNIELPIIPTATTGDWIVGNDESVNSESLVPSCFYVFENSIIKCTKTGRLLETLENEDTSKLAEFEIIDSYNFGKKIIDLTEKYASSYSYYDGDTHYHLGQYLRCLRDIYGIDLMPFYNCFNYKIISDLYLVDDSNEFDYMDINDEDYNSDVQQKYKVVAIPIKFDKTYTIALDCGTQVSLKSVFYGKLGALNAITPSGYGGKLTDTLIEVKSDESQHNKYSLTYGITSFCHPFTYSISSSSHSNDVTDAEMKSYERNLYLIIQLPSNNTSSIVVLEGDYTNKAEKIFNAEYINDLSSVQMNKFFLTQLQLMQFNDGNSYAFSNRLIEYLLDNVITSEDEITQNIERVQLYASELNKNTLVIDKEKNYNYSFKGVWDNSLRAYIYRNYTHTRNKNLDINGFVDKDIEKYITVGR